MFYVLKKFGYLFAVIFMSLPLYSHDYEYSYSLQIRGECRIDYPFELQVR